MQFSETKQVFDMTFNQNSGSGQGGKDGKDGASAYEIAVKNGFEGTEQEWLESLKGEPGVDGKDGADGKPVEPLIVTLTEYHEDTHKGTASHTAEEIISHLKSGGDAYLDFLGGTYKVLLYVENGEKSYVEVFSGYNVHRSTDNTIIFEHLVIEKGNEFKYAYIRTTNLNKVGELLTRVGSLETNMGDIDTALDSILTIQNELIGGDSV